jgi:hypothetical protein
MYYLFIYAQLTTLYLRLYYVDAGIAVCNERMWKRSGIFEVLSWYVPVDTERNHETFVRILHILIRNG